MRNLLPPLVPAKAGTQIILLYSRLRGNKRNKNYGRVCSKIFSPCKSMIWRALFTVNVTASS